MQSYVRGIKNDDSEHELIVKNVVILEANLEDGSKEQFIVSKSLIKNTHATTLAKSNTNRFYFYLNDKIDHGILDDTIYLTKSEIPLEITNGEFKQLLAPHKRKSTLMSKSGLFSVRR